MTMIAIRETTRTGICAVTSLALSLGVLVSCSAVSNDMQVAFRAGDLESIVQLEHGDARFVDRQKKLLREFLIQHAELSEPVLTVGWSVHWIDMHAAIRGFDGEELVAYAMRMDTESGQLDPPPLQQELYRTTAPDEVAAYRWIRANIKRLEGMTSDIEVTGSPGVSNPSFAWIVLPDTGVAHFVLDRYPFAVAASIDGAISRARELGYEESRRQFRDPLVDESGLMLWRRFSTESFILVMTELFDETLALRSALNDPDHWLWHGSF